MKKIILLLIFTVFLCSCSNNGTEKQYSEELFYTEAIKIGDSIYSGAKNKFISFNEDLTDMKVIFEYPDADYYFWGLLKLDENTVCVCFWNSKWQGEQDIRREIYITYDLKRKKAQTFIDNDINVTFPFEINGEMYFFKKKYREFYLWSPIYSLYTLSALDNEKMIADDIRDFAICKKGLYFTCDQETNNGFSTIYFYNVTIEKIEEIIKINELVSFKISGKYILYSTENGNHLCIYNMESKTSNDLEIKKNIGSVEVNNGHIFIYQRFEDNYNYDIIDIDMSNLTMKEALKTDLPGYVGDWHYFIIGPSTPEEEPIPAEKLYTLWRSNHNGESQLVF